METWRSKKRNHITVTAIRLNEENAEKVSAWCHGHLVEEIDPEHPEEKQPAINLMTASGMVRASLGMYVIRVGSGFHAEPSRIFETFYEPVGRKAPPLESAGDTRKRLGFGNPFDEKRMP